MYRSDKSSSARRSTHVDDTNERPSRLLNGLVELLVVLYTAEVVLHSLIRVPFAILKFGGEGYHRVRMTGTHVWGGDLDASYVVLNDLLVIAYRL